MTKTIDITTIETKNGLCICFGQSCTSRLFLKSFAVFLIIFVLANCRMRLASHWQNKKRHCDVSCI
ncbi:hypothetical protein, partial [Limosilactobacillus fermentum]|uniref:hypothetical protein n=1 Tax=Limosilactobacillus fermentum TaxID=1613 RepID=UPI001F0E5718